MLMDLRYRIGLQALFKTTCEVSQSPGGFQFLTLLEHLYSNALLFGPLQDSSVHSGEVGFQNLLLLKGDASKIGGSPVFEHGVDSFDFLTLEIAVGAYCGPRLEAKGW